LFELSVHERVIPLEEDAAAERLLGAAGMLPGGGVGVGAALRVLALATFEYAE